MLSLNNICLAYSYNDIQKKIHTKNICHLNYNFSKTAAIVNPECGSAVYINFKTKQTKAIVTDWPSALSIWKSDTIAYIKGSCGTGCSQSIIFIAPSNKIVCPVHEYRIESLNPAEPPDFYNNDPLVIEPNKKMYICYAEDNVIQVFQMPKKLLKTIYPPKGYFADRASLQGNHIVITYQNVHENVKKIIYPMTKY